MTVGEIHPDLRWHDALGWYFPTLMEPLGTLPMTHDPAIEAQAMTDPIFDDAAQALREFLAAVTPLIRAQVLEEAAKVADDEDGQFSYAGEHRNMAMLQQCCREIAAAIRSLKEPPQKHGIGVGVNFP